MIDFADYWEGVRSEVAASDRDWDRVWRSETVEANGSVWRVDWIRFSSVHDSLVWAWFAVPHDRTPTGACMLWLPGYSYGTPPPDATNLIPGVSTLCVNVHGRRPDEPYVNPAGKRDYILQDIGDPMLYIYRSISQHCLRAAEVATAQPESAPNRFVVGGMSQGGALAVIVAANTRSPRLCFADMPFLSDVRETLKTSSSPIYRAVRNYCANDFHRANEVADVLSLFDPLSHAPLVHIPTWLSVGGRDPSVKRSAVEKVYRALGSQIKQFQFYPEAGHVFLPEMNQTHSRWIDEQILYTKGK